MSDLTPETSSSNAAPVGFKEWAFVCEALGQGVQTLILRKGGIHEGKKGFHFEHEDFWLFPTGFHAQGDQLLWLPEDADKVAVPQDEERELVDVKYFAKTQQIWRITDWDKLAALAPFHVWKEEVVRERFAWNEESCLHIALVRVHKLPITWSFPYLKGYGGCRSWVKLPPEGKDFEPIVTPVLADGVWNETAEKIKAVLG
ncbi:DUF1802 family protein [Verrucomicrobium sp. BvORR034]|uniref:DUF1802 family protein n=1 Tax=Verrucomicrobium sp. BvORR034 TaxID=1396418 RepID=UPI000678C30A|nr:DUF1802 family protein [Verrucomicrobium sp. BvORR034]